MNLGLTIALIVSLACGGVLLYPHVACTLVARLKRAFRQYLVKRYGTKYATDFLGHQRCLKSSFDATQKRGRSGSSDPLKILTAVALG